MPDRPPRYFRALVGVNGCRPDDVIRVTDEDEQVSCAALCDVGVFAEIPVVERCPGS